MKLVVKIILPAFFLCFIKLAGATVERYKINFPDILDYYTLAGDFHMHTVFSDGHVWPPIRVSEAWKQGLDTIAISDHIEHQPHQKDIPTNHNRPYELSIFKAKVYDMFLIKGAEITRGTPPGHYNAIFLEDIDALETKDFLDAVKQANAQNAFVFWNHHSWKGKEKGRWRDLHTTMYKNKWLHGMEVANGSKYYPEAHKWSLEKNLTMMGSSDLHYPSLLVKSTTDSHRTMTLVLVKDKSIDGIKEALLQGRTIVWHKDRLIGREKWLKPMFNKCISYTAPNFETTKYAWLEIHNACEINIKLKRTGTLGPHHLVAKANASTLVKIKKKLLSSPFTLEYTASNLLIAPKTGLPIVINVPEYFKKQVKK